MKNIVLTILFILLMIYGLFIAYNMPIELGDMEETYTVKHQP